MTSRERIGKLLRGEPTDRIPNGLMGCETASVHMLAYDKLKKLFGVKNKRNRLFSFMFNAVPEIEFLEKAGCDIIPLSTKLSPAPFWKDIEKNWKDESLFGITVQVPNSYHFRHNADGSTDWTDVGWHCPAGGLYFDEVPKEDDTDLDEITPDGFDPPKHLPEEYLRSLEEQAKFLYETTDFAISIGETIFDLQVAPGGYVNHFMYMALYPERMKEFLAKSLEAAKSNLIEVDQAVGKYCQIMGIAHDFGNNNDVMIGPQMWREIYKPFYKELFGFWHAHTGMKVNLHSCGSLHSILPDLIEAGVDILNPVQLCAKGMDSKTLSEEFGDRIIFYGGGFDSVACVGKTPEQVYENCRKDIERLSSKGKYIFAGVHNIPGDFSPESYEAMFRAYRDVNGGNR